MLSTIGAALGKAAGWMLRNPTIVLLAVFTAMFVMVVVAKDSEIKTLNEAIEGKNGWRHRNEVAQQIIGTLQANNASMTASLARQNAALDELNGRAATADLKFDQFLAGMGASNAAFAKKMDLLRAAQPGPDKCESAFNLIRSSVE